METKGVRVRGEGRLINEPAGAHVAIKKCCHAPTVDEDVEMLILSQSDWMLHLLGQSQYWVCCGVLGEDLVG